MWMGFNINVCQFYVYVFLYLYKYIYNVVILANVVCEYDVSSSKPNRTHTHTIYYNELNW